MNNIRYEEDGTRYWEVYSVGKGGWLASDQTLSAHIPKLKVLVNVMTPEQ